MPTSRRSADREPYRQPVAWLRCFRGIDTVTAVSLVAELHDFRRFRSARALMAYLGLVPSEHSSGEPATQGDHEGGQPSRPAAARRGGVASPAQPGAEPAAAQASRGTTRQVIAIADRAQERLHRRYWRLVTHGKAHNKAVTAVARELSGFLWAALREHRAAKASEASVG